MWSGCLIQAIFGCKASNAAYVAELNTRNDKHELVVQTFVCFEFIDMVAVT
jgi:hypothetical protein